MSAKDVKKTNINRDYSNKRNRGRKHSAFTWILYVVVILILTSILLYILSRTFLFNIKTIKVSGNSKNYTAEEIVDASGIKPGDNMFVMDSKAAEKNIEEKLTLIENAKIRKHPFDTIEIVVKDAEEAYNISYDNGKYMIVSKYGKIISNGTKQNNELSMISGFDPKNAKVGEKVASKDSQKDNIFKSIAVAIPSKKDSGITNVDISNKYNIKVYFGDGLEFDAGTRSDITYKINLARKVIADLPEGSSGVLEMAGSNQISFRSKEAVEDTERKIAMGTYVTDENGSIQATTKTTINPAYNQDAD